MPHTVGIFRVDIFGHAAGPAWTWHASDERGPNHGK
ncbi:hypothetical protein AYX14_07097 [Cryptococcus neoformans]|nr:hypothetical protein AYX14_07097 [Cryptococcus neoformans var. grubii]